MFPQNYEFNESENSIFADVASKMSAVGFFSIFFGSLNIALSIVHLFQLSQGGDSRMTMQGIGGVSQGIVLLLVGSWTKKAGTSFKQIVDSRGQDIRNLMDAMSSLRKLYTLQYWLLVIALIIVVIALVANLFTKFPS